MANIVPYFSPAKGTTNHIGSVSTKIYNDELYYGVIGNYIFGDYVDPETYDDGIWRKNVDSDEDRDEILITYQTGYGSILHYFPETESTGILVVDDYDNIEIYDVDWDNLTCTFFDESAYISGADYFNKIVATAYYNNKVNIVFDFVFGDVSKFLVYNNISRTFMITNGPANVGDSYIVGYEDWPSNYADIGNGVVAFKLEGNSTYIAHESYIFLLNTITGAGNAVTLPKLISDPDSEGDYWYDIRYPYFSIAPNFSDNSVYIQCEYYVYDSEIEWYEMSSRIFKVTSDGSFSVVATFDDYNDDFYPILMSSQDKIISVRMRGTETLVFYDATSGVELFTKTYVEESTFSNTLDGADNSILMVENTQIQYQVYNAISGSTIGGWEENDITSSSYIDGWEWGWWDEIPASLRWISGSPLPIISGCYTGVYISARGTSPYIQGDLIWSGISDSRSADYVPTTYMEIGKRYRATSTGVFTSNIEEGITNSGFNIKGWYDDSIMPGYNGFGKEGSLPLNLGLPTQGLLKAEDSGDGVHVNVWFYKVPVSASVISMRHGDKDEWLEDNFGFLGLELYNANADEVELSATIDLSGYVVAGSYVRVKFASSYINTNKIVQFMRIIFIDGSYYETTEYTELSGIGNNPKQFYYSFPPEYYGKGLSKLVVGTYFNDYANAYYANHMVITTATIRSAIEMPNPRTLRRIDLDGTLHTLRNLDMVSGFPEYIYPYYMRLVGNMIIYPTNGYSYPMIVHYTSSGLGSNYMKIIHWD